MAFRLLLLLLFGSLSGMAQESDIASKLEFERIPFGLDILDYSSTVAQRIFEDHNGYIWLADEMGIFCFDGISAFNFTEKLRKDFDFDLPETRYLVVLVDTFDNVWMGGEEGLYVFNLSSHKQWTIRHQQELNIPLNDVNRTYNLLWHNDLVYNCTWGGFFAINIQTKETEFYKSMAGLPIWPENRRSAVKYVYPDARDEIIWGSFTFGYFYFDRTRDHFEFFPSRFTNVTEYTGWQYFYTGFFKGDTLIAPSYGNGMVYFDTLSKAYRQYLYEPPGNRETTGRYERVKSYLPYDDDRIIINSEGFGVGIFNLVDHQYTFRRKDGSLFSPPKTDLDMSYDRHGRIWVNKFRSVEPVLQKDSASRHYIQIIKASSRDKSYDRVSLFHYDHIYFDYDQDDFTIEYSLVNELEPEQVTFEYFLKDFHLDWVSNDTSRFLHLPQLPGGTNELLIRAKKDDQVVATKSLYLSRVIPFYYTMWFYISLMAAMLALGLVLFRWRVRRARKQERQKATIQQQLLEMESRALKNQMNPHFIFNSLNSIKSLIQENSDEKAVHYLTQFSKFIRKALDHSEKKLISLEEEIEMCRYYLEIEYLRFEHSFTFNVEVDQAVDTSFVQVPPLILQPFLENAIWHGLLHKEGERILKIQVQQDGDRIKCIIDDNGIGREKAQQIKSAYGITQKSFGTQLIQDRLKISREMYKKIFDLTIIDKNYGGKATGTRVEVTIEI